MILITKELDYNDFDKAILEMEKTNLQARQEEEKQRPGSRSPHSSLVRTSDYRTYDPAREVGEEFVKPVNGHFCRLCKKFFVSAQVCNFLMFS